MEPQEHFLRTGTRGRPPTTSSTGRSTRSPGSRARSAAARRALLHALTLRDEIGQLEYKVWYFASLWYDQDQRDNQINARRQQVQILFAKAAQASAWFDPELLKVPLATVQGWMAADSAALAVYRFAIEDLYRQQEHVLDDKGEHLLSLSSRFSSAPNDAYASLSTADVKHPVIALSTGAEVTLSYGQYRAILATNRNQADRAAAFRAFHGTFQATVNTYASLYNGVLQRDWFYSQARGYGSALDAALHGNNIPTAVVENLIAEAKAGTEPLRRYHRLRKRALGLDTYHSYDAVDSAGRLRPEVSLRRRPEMAARVGRAAGRRLSACDARGAVRPVHRRLREPRQAQRRVFGAGVRRSALHAAQLQRHARCGVHAGARDGPFDAHRAVACAPAVCLRRLHDLRRRSAVDAERGAVSRVHAGAHAPTSASGRSSCSTRSTASSRRSTRR